VKRSYYVYYRSIADAARVRASVGDMQAALAGATGVAGRLLSRVDDRTTWMEVYEDVGDPARFERELALAVERFGLRSLLAAGAERHLERFTAD
jgi:hypothetical protein